MVDRIDKTRLGQLEDLDAYQIEASRDALDEEKQNRQDQSEEDDAPDQPDAFRQQKSKTLESVHARGSAPESVELTLRDVKQSWLSDVDLSTDPSVLFLHLQMSNSPDILYVKLNVARSFALPLKAKYANKPLPLRKYFKDNTFWVQILETIQENAEEITRISTAPGKFVSPERTLSQTFKFRTHRNFWERIGVIERRSNRVNLEVLLAYIIAFIVFLFLFFGILYLST